MVVCLGVFLFGSKFFGTLWASWTSWKSSSFTRLGKFSIIQISFPFLVLPLLLLAPINLDIGMFQVVPEVPKSVFTFLNCLFLHSVQVWMFISSLCSKLLIWVPVSFPSLLVPCLFFFSSLCIAFTFSSVLWPHSTISVSLLITSVLNCASDRLAISLSPSSVFSGAWSVLSFGPYFFVWACLLRSKGRSLMYSRG